MIINYFELVFLRFYDQTPPTTRRFQTHRPRDAGLKKKKKTLLATLTDIDESDIVILGTTRGSDVNIH